MIDTIRFKIKISDNVYNLLKEKSIETKKTDNKDEKVIFKVYRADLYLGSYDRNINLFMSESVPNTATLEFSIPKYYFGHNVYLFYCHNLRNVLYSIYNDLVKFIGEFPKPETWDIYRLDVCYAWKFLDEYVAGKVLEVLKSYKFPRKKTHTFDTSVMITGSTYSLKWYLKKPEYYFHDFPKLLKSNQTNLAYEVANISSGVLRFEVTMRRQCLYKWFGRNEVINYERLNDDIIIEILKMYFKKFFHGKIPSFMSDQTVLQKLLEFYKPQLATKLYTFYLASHNLSKIDREQYFKYIPYSTRQRLINQLNKAGVGLPKRTKKLASMQFSIPSDYAVNQPGQMAKPCGPAETCM